MAAVKKPRAKVLSSSGSLFGDGDAQVALAPTEPAPAMVPVAQDAPEAPKLRAVPTPEPTPEEEVIIESQSDGRFVVSLLRDHGTTVAAVVYTRAQLVMLQRRIGPALEVG